MENSSILYFFVFAGFMRWISNYQLFLFDLDGLLVNTEELHYRAYVRMCEGRGVRLTWDFPSYFRIAQSDSDAIQKQMYSQFPALFEQEPRWNVLYEEKKRAFLDILTSEPSPLLPGVEKLLSALAEKDVKRAVVTHSARAFTVEIKRQNPILDTIPNWFCREDYALPKPNPDGYLKAIDVLAAKDDCIIGFEDSLRGMKALMATRAIPVFVNAIDEETSRMFAGQGVRVYRTLEEFCQSQE